MAVILKFATHAPSVKGTTAALAASEASCDTAEIIIFPGVRIERYEDACPYEPVADATAK